MNAAPAPDQRRVGVVAIARTTFDLELARSLTTAAVSAMAAAGWTCRPAEPAIVTSIDEVDDAYRAASVDPDAPIVVLQATFADATMIIRLAELAGGRPVAVWSFPEPRTGDRLRLNALCGANLAGYSLRRRGHDAAFVHADPQRPGATAHVAEALADAARPLSRSWPEPVAVTASPNGAAALARGVVERLRSTTIGVIGDHPVGFEPCAYDRAAVRDLTGARVDRIELDDLFAEADAVTPVRLSRIRDRVAASVELTPGLEEAGLEQSLRLYGGLHALADRRGWGAVATRCWPECPREYGGAACAPQGMLADDGIPAMCEADVAGAVTALLLREVARADPFVADVVDADRAGGTSTVWHCGQAPTSLAAPGSERRATVHPNTHRALIHEFALAPGRVTVARLTQAGPPDRPWALVLGGGELLGDPRPFVGTCGVMRWDRPVDDVLATVFDFGLEHHVGVVPGDHQDVLTAIAGQWDIPVLRLGVDRRTRTDRAPAFTPVLDPADPERTRV